MRGEDQWEHGAIEMRFKHVFLFLFFFLKKSRFLKKERNFVFDKEENVKN